MRPIHRAQTHGRNQSWACAMSSITLEWFDDMESALAAETAAIRCERPEWNFMHNISHKKSVGRFSSSHNAKDPSTWGCARAITNYAIAANSVPK